MENFSLFTIIVTSSIVVGHVTIIDDRSEIVKLRTIDVQDAAITFFAPSRQHYFSQFLYDGNYMLVGSRNYIYNVSLLTLNIIHTIEWLANEETVERCHLRQKSKDDCENYVRMIIKLKQDEYLICGTNAFNPICRTYLRDQEGKLFVVGEESGIARCPYGPAHNSTALYTAAQNQNWIAIGFLRPVKLDCTHQGAFLLGAIPSSELKTRLDGRLYTATAADGSSRDSLIYSQPLRTEQHNSQWLNDANFVGNFDFHDKVYFFFRETAVEHTNCGKVVLSRVGQVCKTDTGGNRVLRQTWTSFFKTRLNCSIPGPFPFYFDEIHSVSNLGRGNIVPTTSKLNRTLIVYGVFTTPVNSIHGSAVCAFKLTDIVKSFEGPFKEQKTAHSNWLPVFDKEIPQPHPASVCLNDTQQMSDQTLNFIKTHPLLDVAVPTFGGQPIVVHTGFQTVMTEIAVDWQVSAADHRRYDVLFVGTDDGRILKIINKLTTDHQMVPFVIEVLRVFKDEPVVHLNIYLLPESRSNVSFHQYSGTPAREKALLVASRRKIISIPLQRCHLQTTCRYQNVESGFHPKCNAQRLSDITFITPSSQGNEPNNPFNYSLSTTNHVDDDEVSEEEKEEEDLEEFHHANISSQLTGPCYTVSWPADNLYTTESMAVATTVCSLVSLTIGICLGYGVIAYRRSTVRDLQFVNTQRSANWAGHVTAADTDVTKSQLIAILNSRQRDAGVSVFSYNDTATSSDYCNSRTYANR